MNIYELSPAPETLASLFLPTLLPLCRILPVRPPEDTHFLRQHLEYTTKSADLCQPYAGVHDVCEAEEEECIVSL